MKTWRQEVQEMCDLLNNNPELYEAMEFFLTGENMTGLMAQSFTDLADAIRKGQKTFWVSRKGSKSVYRRIPNSLRLMLLTAEIGL